MCSRFPKIPLKAKKVFYHFTSESHLQFVNYIFLSVMGRSPRSCYLSIQELLGAPVLIIHSWHQLGLVVMSLQVFAHLVASSAGSAPSDDFLWSGFAVSEIFCLVAYDTCWFLFSSEE